MTERTLLREVAFAYVRAVETYERESARGNTDKRDDALSKVLQMEKSISIRELNGAWR